MALFFCFQCDGLCDSDDGCDTAPNGTDLICIECVAENEEDSDA